MMLIRYRRLVDQKLRTASELYEFIVKEFREARSVLLGLLVIVILILELVPIFRGSDFPRFSCSVTGVLPSTVWEPA